MKLTLAVVSGSLSGRQFELETGSLTLGRRADSTLHFDHKIDSGVSNLHATVQSYPDGFYIRDQQSTNGTFVNGISVKEAWLKSGDSIRLAREGPEIRAIIEAEVVPTVPQETLPPPPTMKGSIGQTITNIGYYNPIKKDKESHHVGLWIGLGIAAFVGLIVAVVMIASLGFVGALVGALMAFTPAPCYLLVYWWIDRYDPEPVWAIAGAFGWGALFALLVSFVVNTAFGTVAAALIGGPGGDTLAAIVSAPLIEEGTKGLGVVMILVFLRKEFDGVLDGIVYAGVIALGFATGENVLYYGRSFNEDGFNGLLLTAFLRGVLSPFAHSFFTSMTGIGCGISRETHNKALRILMPIIGYFCAVFLHSMWNTVASIAKDFYRCLPRDLGAVVCPVHDPDHCDGRSRTTNHTPDAGLRSGHRNTLPTGIGSRWFHGSTREMDDGSVQQSPQVECAQEISSSGFQARLLLLARVSSQRCA
jgi:protease PrsW